MKANTKFLIHVTTTASLLAIVGATAGPQSQVFDEHLFAAGNDSNGTAVITYASRLTPDAPPTTVHFHNFSFPSSCSSHPSRCSQLVYTSPTSNNVRFFVPLNGSSLGVAEFSYNGMELSLVHSRTIAIQNRCSPIAVLKDSRVICIGDRQYLVSCKVNDADTIDGMRLECERLALRVDNLTLLSNFVAYGVNRNDFLYFTYGTALYAIHPLTDSVNLLSYLSRDYSHCRHLELVESSGDPQVASYCYLASDASRIRVEYFRINEHSFVFVANNDRDVDVVRYDCPSPQTYVDVPNNGTYSSYYKEGSYVGSFQIVGNNVTFAKCFDYRNETHFVYRDKYLGTYMQPNISINLQSSIVNLSTWVCQTPICEQPFIYDDKYFVLLHGNSNEQSWSLEVKNISRQSIVTLDGQKPSQVTLVTDFIVDSSSEPPTTDAVATTVVELTTSTTSELPTSTNTSVHTPRSISPHVIGPSVLGGILAIAATCIIVLAVLLRIFCKRQRRPKGNLIYSPVDPHTSTSRQGSPPFASPIEMALLPTNGDQSIAAPAPPPTSAPKEPSEVRPSAVVVANPSSTPGGGDGADRPFERDDYPVVGASNENIAQIPATSAAVSDSTGQQADSTQLQRPHPSDSTPHSDVLPQLSNTPTSPAEFSQATRTRPQSLNFHGSTLDQHNPAPPDIFTPTASTGIDPRVQNRHRDSISSNISSHSRLEDGGVNSPTTPHSLSSPPVSPHHTTASLAEKPFSTYASMSSLRRQHSAPSENDSLPSRREDYQGVGSSQDDLHLLRPWQCSQASGLRQPSVPMQPLNPGQQPSGMVQLPNPAQPVHQASGPAVPYFYGHHRRQPYVMTQPNGLRHPGQPYYSQGQLPSSTTGGFGMASCNPTGQQQHQYMIDTSANVPPLHSQRSNGSSTGSVPPLHAQHSTGSSTSNGPTLSTQHSNDSTMTVDSSSSSNIRLESLTSQRSMQHYPNTTGTPQSFASDLTPNNDHPIHQQQFERLSSTESTGGPSPMFFSSNNGSIVPPSPVTLTPSEHTSWSNEHNY